MYLSADPECKSSIVSALVGQVDANVDVCHQCVPVICDLYVNIEERVVQLATCIEALYSLKSLGVEFVKDEKSEIKPFGKCLVPTGGRPRASDEYLRKKVARDLLEMVLLYTCFVQIGEMPEKLHNVEHLDTVMPQVLRYSDLEEAKRGSRPRSPITKEWMMCQVECALAHQHVNDHWTPSCLDGKYTHHMSVQPLLSCRRTAGLKMALPQASPYKCDPFIGSNWRNVVAYVSSYHTAHSFIGTFPLIDSPLAHAAQPPILSHHTATLPHCSFRQRDSSGESRVVATNAAKDIANVALVIHPRERW